MRYFGPFTYPHIVRQTDTMAVSFRYWMRWAIEDKFSLYPAVLNPGDGFGIQSMELPLYNLLFFPFFGLGFEFGRVLIQILSLAGSLGLTYFAYLKWKDIEVAGYRTREAFLFMLLTGIASLFFHRFMTDYYAFMLVMIAVGLSFKPENAKPVVSFFLLSLGLLMKPPVAVALAPLLLAGDLRHIIRSILLWVLPALAVTVLYYTKGIAFLRSISDQPEYFYTAARNPVKELKDFFSNPAEIYELFEKVYFGRYIFYILTLGWMYRCYKEKRIILSPIVGLFLIQIFAVAAIDGKHSFIHNYYFIGLSFTVALLIVRAFHTFPKSLIFALVGIITINTVDRIVYETNFRFKKNTFAECSKLKKSHPEFPWDTGYTFRAHKSKFPLIGLCFGEKQGSTKNEFGIYFRKQHIPENCKEIDSTKRIVIVKCGEV